MTPISTPVAHVVLKIGGSLLDDARARAAALGAVARMTLEGRRVVAVHGGGREVSRWLERLGIRSEFREGLRVTTPEAMEVIQAVLAGLLNKELVLGLSTLGVDAVGVCGADAGSLVARPARESLGFVGEPHRFDATLVGALLDRGLVPVIASVAPDAAGAMRNVNADSAAGAIAAAVGASCALFLTDTAGVLGPGGAPYPVLSSREVSRLVSTGVIDGGMIPKVRAALHALDAGVERVVIAGCTSAEQIVSGTSGEPVLGTLLAREEEPSLTREPKREEKR